MELRFIKKRNNDVVEFDINRIKIAITKAYSAVGETIENDMEDLLTSISTDVSDLSSRLSSDDLVNVEQIQDIVEKNLMKINRYEVAKAYIIYRQQRSEERQKEHQEVIEKFETNKLQVTKNDWSFENFDMSKIKSAYDKIVWDLSEDCPFNTLQEKFKNYVIEWIKTSDIIKLIIKSAVDLISVENIKWHYIAARFAMMDIYKKASRNRSININQIYSSNTYKDLFDDYIKRGLYYKDFYKYYSEEDILKAWSYISKTRDMEYGYTTVMTINKRYLLNPNKVIKELPQEMYMSAALFLAIPEAKENRLDIAFKIYDYCSDQKISLATPTLLNARTNFHQLSSCFKMNIDDDLRSIYHNIENMAQISKYWGWIWTYLGHVRCKGSSIRGIKWASSWVMPWIKVINDTAIAVNQLWARMWSISVTLDMWHRDIYDFLDMQTETWDIRRKSYDVFPAVAVPDLFMKRVMNDQNWTVFDPREVHAITWKRLENLFGDEFEKFYEELENRTDLDMKEVGSAKELFKKFLKTVVETWMPYVFFRDTANNYNPNKHTWMVYSTQLCTEIIQNASVSKFVDEVEEDGNVVLKYKPWDTVVCNLASINVAKVHTEEEISKVIPIAMRILDNVITLNFYPIKEAELTSMKYRSVGLGFLGLAEYLATHKLRYDSPEAVEHADKLFEVYGYHTLKSSNDLAKERWTYKLFPWSDWSKWLLFGRDEKWYLNNTAKPYEWAQLIKDIKETWVRFAYHLSPAPNTSTSLIVWTTAWILPIYKKYFVETNLFGSNVNVAPNLNKENFWFYKEYVNMNMPDVIDMVSVIQKWIDQSISFEWIINPMNVSPQQLYSYYIKAWQQWIKTVYYVRSMSLDVKECVSCSW